MHQPSKEYKIIKSYIDTGKMTFGGYLFFFLRIPKNILEGLIRYIPGPMGIIIRRFYYKLILKKVGINVVIDEGVYFQGNDIELDDWACIDKFCVLRSFSNLRIGKRVHLGVGVVIHAGINSQITIDDNTGIADRCSIYSLTNSYSPNKRMGGPVCKSSEVFTRSGPIYIEKECFLGIGCLVLPNVKIGFASIMSSQSIVRKNIDAFGIYDKNCKLLMKRKFDKNLFYN